MGSVSGWAEAILFSLAFVLVLGFVVAEFNIMYGQNNVLPITDNTTESLFITYQSNSQQKIEGGEVVLGEDSGIGLTSSYALAKDAIVIVWGFLSGGWIEDTINMINLGEAGNVLGKTLRIIYFLSLIFALLYALFKVVL